MYYLVGGSQYERLWLYICLVGREREAPLRLAAPAAADDGDDGKHLILSGAH